MTKTIYLYDTGEPQVTNGWRFKVTKLVNTLAYPIDDLLRQTQVEDLISRGYKVVITGKK